MNFFRKLIGWVQTHQNIAMLTALGVLAAGLITVIVVIFLPKGEEVPAAKQSSSAAMTTNTVDVELESEEPDPTNDTVDPENTELGTSSGAKVDASELQQESGKTHGIDVSKWQGKIDWKQVKNSGIEFAFIRIGYRGENGTIYRDANADYNIQQAEKNGVLVGVYFFSTAINTAEAAEEANWTLNAIKGYSISYPVVYDCEGFLQSSSRMYGVTAAERGDNAAKFLQIVKSAGYDAMLYGATTDLQNPDCWDLSKIEPNYKIWVARYPAVTYPTIQKPDYDGRCDAWQYTNKGAVSGINGNVDMVVAYFKKSKADPKDSTATPNTASTPLTEEEKLYKAVNEEVTAKSTTNLRSAASTNSDIVATLQNGTFIRRIGIGTNGWSKLEYNGRTVYAISSYLTTDRTPVTSTAPSDGFTAVNEQVTAKSETNLRTAPSRDNSEVVYTLKNGEVVTRIGTHPNGWSKLEYNGQTVYAISSYLTTDLTPSTPQTPSDGFTPVEEQVTAKTSTNLRTAPSTDNSEIVYTLPNGEYVKRIGIHSNGWSKLEYNGQTVYAISSYLTQ